MTWTRRRLIGAATAFVAVFGIVVVARVATPLLAVGTAYKAKVLCSEVFVAGRHADVVLSDLAIDDLRPLGWISATVDTIHHTATARFFLFPGRHARYDELLGCALVSREQYRAAQQAIAPTRAAVPAPLQPSATATTPTQAALEAVLADAFAEPDPALPRRTRAVVILQHGAVVAERYAEGVQSDTPLIGWSMTKSVMNALVGIAVRDSMLTLNDPVAVAEWKTRGDGRGAITVNDLLHMSSGLRSNEAQADPSSDLFRMLFAEPDMAAFAMSQPLQAASGLHWQYSSGTSLILSRLLRNVMGDSAYRHFPRAALFQPLGMTHAVLEADASGTFIGSSYMYATAREWARFGQLYLQDGVWEDKRILPSGWVAYTRAPAPAAQAGTYGAHFWLATPEEYRGPAVALPADMFQAIGHEGQFVTIVPSHDVVIVRLGRTRYPGAWAHDRFIAAVLAALKN